MKFLKLFFLVCVALPLLGCGQSQEVAATLNGKPVYMKELDQAFGGKIAEQVYNLRKAALDNIVEQKLLEQAAAEKKATIDEFLKQEVDSKVGEPTEEEVKAIYEANAKNYGDSFEKVKDSISAILKRNRVNIQRNQLIAGLKEKAKVEQRLEKPPVIRAQVSAGNDPCIGPTQAKITMIEFSDFQCPFCGRARPTIQQIIETYKNDLKYCFRDFPLSFHQDSFLAHLAAACANEQGTDKFWEYNRKLFSNQQAIKADNLKAYAKEVGLNMKTFNECLTSRKYEGKVQKDIQEGVQAGVAGTPGFFINGIPISGAQPFAKFKEVIDEELKK